MLIIGELINATRKSIAKAITERDKEYLQNLARQQVEAGADVIDINGAVGKDEVSNIRWLVEIIQEVVDVPLCIDSPSPEAIKEGLALCNKKAYVNSISLEKERWDGILPLLRQYNSKVIALCMSDEGMPDSVDDRLKVTDKLVGDLVQEGIAEEDIYLDPLIKPLGVNHEYGLEGLETTRLIKEKYPKVHIVSGLSNISYGLPERRLINRTYMTLCAGAGMDAFILDPLDQAIMSQLTAAKALVGQDEFCMNYITEVRAGKIKA